MSRSYKKHPWVTDHHVKSTSERKKFANKKVRNTEDLPNRGAFKKIFQTYDICDYKFFQTKEQAIAEYEEILNNPDYGYNQEILEKYPTLEFWLYWNWKKYYLRK